METVEGTVSVVVELAALPVPFHVVPIQVHSDDYLIELWLYGRGLEPSGPTAPTSAASAPRNSAMPFPRPSHAAKERRNDLGGRLAIAPPSDLPHPERITRVPLSAARSASSAVSPCSRPVAMTLAAAA